MEKNDLFLDLEIKIMYLIAKIILQWRIASSAIRIVSHWLTQTHLRHALSPLHAEAIQFLHNNRELGSAETVSKVI